MIIRNFAVKFRPTLAITWEQASWNASLLRERLYERKPGLGDTWN